MSKKRLFQIFDEMNVNDEKNKTALLPCAFTMVEAKTAKGGGHVTMGVEAGIINKLFLGEVQAVLVIFDKKEYHRLADEPVAMTEAEKKAERYEKALREIKKMAVFPKTENESGVALYYILKQCEEALTHKTSTGE